MSTVKDVMSKAIQAIHSNAMITDVAAAMRDHKMGMMPVLKGEAIVGTITDRDIVVKVVAEGKDPKITLVRDTMSPGVQCCYEDQTLEGAAQLMSDHQIRRLPVLDRNEKLVGIVSIGDLAESETDDRQVGRILKDVSKG